LEHDTTPVHCSRCVHYWITHAPQHPHGCRAFGVKSSRLPMIEIREASGTDCEAFEPKAKSEAAR